MKEISFFIDGEPQAWQRPKTRLVNGYVQHYSPAETKKYEKKIADTYKQLNDAPFFEKGTPIHVSIHFEMAIPQSLSKKKRYMMCTGEILHTKRPDVDNMAKAVIDGLNGVAWGDDSQIVSLNLRKRYSVSPSVWVHIREEIE